MRFKHKKTGVVIVVLDNRAIKAYEKGNMWEPVASASTQEIKDVPEDPTSHEPDWESYTKNEIVAELVKRGIGFSGRRPKPELIDLLKG